MKTPPLLAFLFAVLFGMAPGLLAHGGGYRSPPAPPDNGGGVGGGGGGGGGGNNGGAVGDGSLKGSGGGNPGPSGPSTPGPSGPATPGPSGPATPGPMGPSVGLPAGGAGPARGPTTGGGIPLEEDPTRWQVWWEFNKDPYLNLKHAVHERGQVTGSDDYFLGRTAKSAGHDTLKPTDEEVRAKAVPALFRAVEETKQRDIVSSALVALARIGLERERTLALLRTHLGNRDQEVAETAAIALGILGTPEAVPLLVDLVDDGPAGRTLAARPGGVGYRTRAFAAYALGLAAHANADLALKETVFACLAKVLADTRASQRDLKVAAIQSMRLLGVAPSQGYRGEALHYRVLAALSAILENGSGVDQLAQAHVPAAIGSLVGRDTYAKGDLKRRFTATLDSQKASPWMLQSCALALGQMARPDEPECSRVLQDFARDGKDQQARYFAFISLGQIGGDKNRSFLLQHLQNARRIDLAWVALAVGVLGFEARHGGPDPQVDGVAGDAVQRQLGLNRNRETQAALCVALGLIGHTDAAEDVLRILREKHNDDLLVSYACIGLGLMKHRPAIQQIRAVAGESVRREMKLKHAAIALGLLGDKTTTGMLVALLKEKGTSLVVQAAVASGLGQIGDAGSLDPLTDMLGNREIPNLGRAFAAVALGLVADKEDRPWNSKIAVNLNYRANTETLTDQNRGVLDIL